MALLPRMLRPSVIIRRKALYSGILGQSTMWKVIGVLVFGKRTITKFFGRNPEVIEVASLGSGRAMQVVTTKPVTRRRRRKMAKAGLPVPSLAEHRRLGRLWAKAWSKPS